MIRLFRPYVPQEGIGEVVRVLESDIIGQGPKVDQFERDFSNLFDVKYPVSVNSGSSALEMAYDLIGLKKGDEVITTPLTCSATNIFLARRGVKLVWADILPDTLCIDPLDVHAKITSKTKAVVQVHLGGLRADVGRIHIPVISDAAQALGVFTGDYTCCSFQAIKHITTGDGGMVTCPDEETYKKAKTMRWFGIDRERKLPEGWENYRMRMMSFDLEMLGAKRHMNDIAATLGIAGLHNYNRMMKHRSDLFDIYREELSKVDGIKLLDCKGNTHWLATVLVERRDDFARNLWEHNIESNIVQVRNDGYTVFGGKKADLPVMNMVEDKYISLPIGMHVSADDVRLITDIIKKGW